jgi:hypothetical protein
MKAFVEIQMKEAFQACFVAYVCDPKRDYAELESRKQAL